MPEFPIEVKTERETDTQARFIIEPLALGFGHTLGNSLRRVLLGQLPGAAITKLKVNDIVHEFSPIPGVVEDVVELILNLKAIHFAMENRKTTIVTLEATGAREVTAGDLNLPAGISVTNPDQHIATLSGKDSQLKLALTVEYGKGYLLPNTTEKKAFGELRLDADFSPVQQVNYWVENARVGRITDLDRLVLEVMTNGAVTPSDALKQAAAILVDHFYALADGTTARLGEASLRRSQAEVAGDADDTVRTTSTAANARQVYLEELQIPTRVLNTLKEAGVRTVADVKEKGEDGLRKIKNVGPKTVKLVLKKVEEV